MKFNNLMLGLGSVLAISLTACHDDPTYTPADKVTTPAAYFNMSEDHEVTLDTGDSEFEVSVYRAEGTGEETVAVTTKVSAPEGVATDVFTIPANVTFKDGETEAKMDITFNLEDIVPLKDYIFNFTVAGESTPYFLTTVDYTVAYVPWTTVTNADGTSSASTIYNDGLLTRPWELSVEVQEHPGKPGLYRIYHPYLNAPELEGTAQLYPADDPCWLYVNATNPAAVYFSDRNGAPVTYYHTGWDIYADELDKGEGEVVLICLYSQYLLGKNLVYPGASVGYGYEQFAEDFGVAEDGVISFTDSKICWTAPYRTTDPDGYLYSYPVWRLTLASAEPKKVWETLGMGTYSDTFLSTYFNTDFESYAVTVEQNIDNPKKYRILNPYKESGGFPYESPGNDTADYNVEFDCSNPDMVLMPMQEFGWYDNNINYGGCNAGAWYYYGYAVEGAAMSVDQIIAAGLNDKLTNGTIHINHPIIIEGDKGIFLYEDKKYTLRDGYLVLPQGAAATNMVMKGATRPTLHGGRLNLRKYMPLAPAAQKNHYKKATSVNPSRIASGHARLSK